MHLSDGRVSQRFKAIGLLAAVSLLFAGVAQAGNVAYMGTADGSFGKIDLDTGAFTLLGNSGVTLFGLGLVNNVLYGAADDDPGKLFSVNPANGLLTAIGTAGGVNYYGFGSTTTGLYGIDGETADLYSIDPASGAATRLGATGITFADWSNLSAGAGTLYFANGNQLYTLDTTNGAATLIGNTGGPRIGAMVFANGTLYGGENSTTTVNYDCEGECGPGPAANTYRIDILNAATGQATPGPLVTGINDAFFALAPEAETPEPATWLGMGAGCVAIAFLRRRRDRSSIPAVELR